MGKKSGALNLYLSWWKLLSLDCNSKYFVNRDVFYYSIFFYLIFSLKITSILRLINC